MTRFHIEAERSPDWDSAEVRRRLGRVYALILSHEGQARRGEAQGAVDEKAAGNQIGTAGDTPAQEPRARG